MNFYKGDRVQHLDGSTGTVYQNQNGWEYVYVEYDNEPGIAKSTNPGDIRIIL